MTLPTGGSVHKVISLNCKITANDVTSNWMYICIHRKAHNFQCSPNFKLFFFLII